MAPASAGAVTVTIGPPSLSFTATGAAKCDSLCNSVFSQGTVSDPAALLSVPADGTVTEWRVVSAGGGVADLHLRILRPLPGLVFASVGRSPNATFRDGIQPNAMSLPIRAGDHIGVEVASSEPDAGVSRGSGGGYIFWGSLPDGSSAAAFGNASGTLRLNATVELALPEVHGLAPSTGPAAGGQGVIVSGQHFTGAGQVMFGAVPAQSFSVDSNTQITAVAPPGTGTVDVTVTGPGGTSASGAGSKFTYGLPDGGVPDDGKRPTVSLLTMQPTRFVAANTGPSLIAATVGSQVIYELSEPATTTFTVQRALKGRRKGRKCVPPPKARKGRKCTRYKTVKGKLSHSGGAGLNRFRFMGRLRGKALKRGKYRLVAVATDAVGGRSKPKGRGFRIVR